MTLKWNTTPPQMGTGASSSNLLSAQRRGQGCCQSVGVTPVKIGCGVSLESPVIPWIHGATFENNPAVGIPPTAHQLAVQMSDSRAVESPKRVTLCSPMRSARFR